MWYLNARYMSVIRYMTYLINTVVYVCISMREENPVVPKLATLACSLMQH